MTDKLDYRTSKGIFVIVVDDYDWKDVYAHKAYMSKEAAEVELSRMKECGAYKYCHLEINEIELIE